MKQHTHKLFDEEISELENKILNMGKACGLQLSQAIKALWDRTGRIAPDVIAADEIINDFQEKIQTMAAEVIAKRQTVAVDLRFLVSTIKIASELERIGDYAGNIAKRSTKIKTDPDEQIVQMIIDMAEICHSMLSDALEAYLDEDEQKAYSVWHRDDDIDRIYAAYINAVSSDMVSDSGNIERNTQLLFIGRCCERIGDHITNIVEDIVYIRTGKQLKTE